MSAQDRSQPTMTPTPLQRFIVVAAVVLSLLPAACVATIPFVPYGTANGDSRFTPGYNDRVYGPFPLPVPMPFPDGETQSEYYPTTTGGIFFKPIASATYVYDYTTYSSTYGPMIGAANSHMHNDATDSSGGYYHRTISGPGPALDALWSDVLPGGIPIVPTAGLVFTVDNSYLYAYPDTTSSVSTQTIVLWNSASTLMLFRIKNIVYSTTAVIHYGGYLAPNSFYSIPGAATTWASSSNTGVDGLYSALVGQIAQPSKTPVPSPTATPKPSASPSLSSSFSLSPSQTQSDTKTHHSTSPSSTASILVSLTKLTPSLSLSPTTSSSKSLSNTLRPSATAQSPSLSVSQSPSPSMSLSHTVTQSVTVSISESSSMSLSKTIPRSASAESPSLSASQSKSSMSLSHTVAQSASESISESSSKSLSKTIPSSLTAQSPSLSVTRSVSTISFSSSPSVTASPSTTSTGTLHRTFSNSSSPSRSGPTNSNSASHSRTLRVSLSQSLPTPTTSHSVSSSDKYEADGAGWQTIVMIAVPGIAGLAIVFGAILAVKHVSAGVTMTSAAAGVAGSLPPPPPASSSLPF